jgi:Alpha/beta hydrolase domain
MMLHSMSRFAVLTTLTLLTASLAHAEVTRVEVTSRQDVAGGRAFGAAGTYEQIRGRIFFALDPAHPRNARIADIALAPRNAQGRVEASADLWILAPKDATKGNGTALVEVVNRGNSLILARLNRATAPTRTLETDAELGDGLMMRLGYTMVWVGWEFDVRPGPGRLTLTAPAVAGVTGMISGTFVPSDRTTPVDVDTLAGYRPVDAASARNVLSVLAAGPGTAATVVPRARWTLKDNTVSMVGGFEPGRTYELSYEASNPPVAGIGYAAIRDTTTWIKQSPAALVRARYAIAFGVSQSGRFLRGFLYEGFNAGEDRSQAFDGVMAHIAGASRIDINRRWATPVSQGQYDATAFPFANASMRDPLTGATDGLLSNARTAGYQPKIIYTNSSVEYWGGARSAALIHTTPDGTKDADPPANVRIYLLAGTQHGPSNFPPSRTAGQLETNANDYYWSFRALVPAMDRWIKNQGEPPANRYPKLADGTLTTVAGLAFPKIPTVATPGPAIVGMRVANPLVAANGGPGMALPLLVPQVDADGNERTGIRLPDVAVPLATYTGWNLRRPETGAPERLVPLMGAWIPFPATTTKARTRDPRTPIDGRYGSKDDYLARVKRAAEALVSEGFVADTDVAPLVQQAAARWDVLTKATH